MMSCPLLYYETLSISTQSAPEQRRKSFFSLSTSAAPYVFAAAAMCWIVPCFIFTHVGIVSSPHIFYKFCASSSHLAWLSSVALTALKMLKRYREKCLPTTSTTISTTFFRSESSGGGRNRIIAINTATKYDIAPAMNAHTPPTLTHTPNRGRKQHIKIIYVNDELKRL